MSALTRPRSSSSSCEGGLGVKRYEAPCKRYLPESVIGIFQGDEREIEYMIRHMLRIGLVLLSLSCTLSIQSASAETHLAVWTGEPKRMVTSFPIQPGETFSIRFINSIYLAPAIETFIYEPGRGISLVKVQSPSAGVFEYYGLVPDHSGTALVRVNIPEIRLRSHDYVNHQIAIGDRVFSFNGLIKDGDLVVIRIEQS